MFKKFLSAYSGAFIASRLLNLTLGVGATLAMATPALAQSSTIIYQRTTTYDNHQYPHVRQYIYGSPISTPYPVNPITGQIINNSNSLFPAHPNSFFPANPSTGKIINETGSLFPRVRVYRQPRIRQYVNDSTLVNPVLVNPNIRNSTIINPTIINNHYPRRPRKGGSLFMYSFP